MSTKGRSEHPRKKERILGKVDRHQGERRQRRSMGAKKVNKCCARVLVHQLAAVTISPSLSVYSHQVCFPVRVSISNVFLKTPFVQVVLHATNLLMDRYVSTRFVFVSRSPYLIKKPHPLMGRRAVISCMALNNQTS